MEQDTWEVFAQCARAAGFSLKTRVLWQAAARAHVHLFCQVLSLGLTPLIGFGIYKALKTASWMDPNLASGLAVSRWATGAHATPAAATTAWLGK